MNCCSDERADERELAGRGRVGWGGGTRIKAGCDVTFPLKSSETRRKSGERIRYRNNQRAEI